MYSCPTISTLRRMISTMASSTHSLSSKGMSSHVAGMLWLVDACTSLCVGSRRTRRKKSALVDCGELDDDEDGSGDDDEEARREGGSEGSGARTGWMRR